MLVSRISKVIPSFVVLASLSAACQMAWAEEPVLNIYNWNDYIGKDTIRQFEKETGIKVKYDVYDSNETLQAKLLTGKSGYDLVVPSYEFAGKQIQLGVYRKLDKAKLSNLTNLDSNILKKMQPADPGNQVLVPYMWGTTSVAINEDKVKKALGGNLPTDAWRLVFDPSYTSKLKGCGISYMDNPSDVFAMQNIYLGKNANDFSKESLDKNVSELAKVRKDIRLFNASPIDLLANGDVCVALAFSGDALAARNRAEEAKNGQKIRYIIPQKGTVVWVDSLAIPKDAKHPDNAHKFINFILRPQITASISNEIFYANANTKATAYLDKAISGDPAVYVPEGLMKMLVAEKIIPANEQRFLTQSYTRFKTNK
ncbi:polyamine ABC transporter substrate-binding protein [Leeia sp. TBRC 13508]|uniref:Putrescine-binding periplasmic protein n=1 Tax=Leeia speluncae TaxID=2884804 RepID=A0ABS8D6Q3_9NEIS|nr:polyamine ABC transporter substrate-binding protein [Leeia speluncae]MCB6183318.1 polyamine ABC transporter substrate-binding protein [Leeia speluncae]